MFSHLKPIYRVPTYYHYLRCLRNLLSWKSFHSIENLKKLQKSFHKVFLLLRFCLFLFSRSHIRFTLSKQQQQETSLPVIQRLKRKKTKPFNLQQMQICPKTFVYGSVEFFSLEVENYHSFYSEGSSVKTFITILNRGSCHQKRVKHQNNHSEHLKKV